MANLQGRPRLRYAACPPARNPRNSVHLGCILPQGATLHCLIITARSYITCWIHINVIEYHHLSQNMFSLRKHHLSSKWYTRPFWVGPPTAMPNGSLLHLLRLDAVLTPCRNVIGKGWSIQGSYEIDKWLCMACFSACSPIIFGKWLLPLCQVGRCYIVIRVYDIQYNVYI